MQITSVLVTSLLAAAVSAKGHNNGTASAKGHNTGTASVTSQCRSIAHMTKLIDLASNQTLLEDKTDGNQTKIDAIKAKAANFTTSLSALTSNTTLMDQCAIVTAHDEAILACGQIHELEKMMATAANDTKLQSKFDGNATKIDAFKAKASAMATKLADLQSNATQTTFCAAQDDVQTCKSISKLQKTIAMAGNNTALQNKFDGNATKIDHFKTKATEAQTKLDALMSNSTLMTTCSGLTQAGATTQGSTNNTGSSDKKSPAARLQSSSHMASAAFVVLLGSAVFML
ncbi:hypothetical protein F5Y19DRAFT_278797 [Xylariaceae sp. FL1651]|nr:hypothetical protein F5Y19DRAFT_278797 [Xylariaceae sp. FL1651]